MTTSGTTTSTLLASDLVTLAMKELGLLSSGEEPTGEEYADGLSALNWMLKSWQSRGLTSWRDTDGVVLFAIGQATNALDPFCLDVLDARLVQGGEVGTETGTMSLPFPPYVITSDYFPAEGGNERLLQRWERAQYRQLPNKGTPGWPTAYTISKTIGGIAMSVWPVPNANMTVRYSYTRVIEDVTDGAQTIDVPQEWLELAYLGLAVRLAPLFGVTRLDPAAVQSIAQRAATLEQLLLDQDRPASLYMGSAMGRNF